MKVQELYLCFCSSSHSHRIVLSQYCEHLLSHSKCDTIPSVQSSACNWFITTHYIDILIIFLRNRDKILGIHFQAVERYEHDIVLEMFRYLLHTPTEESISLVCIFIIVIWNAFLICKAIADLVPLPRNSWAKPQSPEYRIEWEKTLFMQVLLKYW